MSDHQLLLYCINVLIKDKVCEIERVLPECGGIFRSMSVKQDGEVVVWQW